MEESASHHVADTINDVKHRFKRDEVIHLQILRISTNMVSSITKIIHSVSDVNSVHHAKRFVYKVTLLKYKLGLPA